MASSLEFVRYAAEQMGAAGEITYKKMFIKEMKLYLRVHNFLLIFFCVILLSIKNTLYLIV